MKLTETMTTKTLGVNAEDDLAARDKEPMTEQQAVRLRELCERTGEPFDTALTKYQASRRLAYLEELAD
ncbi:DUF3072 domain-containing protein [Citreimonas salinaria]|uniref:Uncharacterized protein n=1 Tax=Citreimonas salinaria TaxID=321339 RepID=A0A1H3HZG0_9RHOB|nr:DUF3072 domain-containing protein [Citreimonas salinaria]SDY20174.1 Protein of unknown function [Citreimonas salinaria]